MPKRKMTSLSPLQEARAISLPQEEPDFPRGGSSVLTPAEIREARSQAEAEFESEGQARKKQRGSKRDAQRDEDMQTFRGGFPKSVELLRYKSLSIGMKILGIISEVGHKDLIVSLPGGLRGFVRAEEALDLFPQGNSLPSSMKYSIEDTQQTPVKEMAEEEERTNISLKELFSEGQLVPCTVTKLDQSKRKVDEKKSKRIGLSLKLSSLHKGLTIDAMHEGLLMQAFVSSVEDHGYLISFGVPGITGFLLHTDNAGEGEALPRLRKGHLLQGVISSIDRKRSMVMLKTDPELVASSMIKEIEGLTLGLLIPGTLVNARVRAVLKNGLLLSFLTYFTGSVDVFHLEDPLPDTNWSERFSENQRLKARILHVDLVTKAIGLTLNIDLGQNKCPSVDVKLGKVYENAIVRRVDPTIGLLVELPSNGASVAGYVHISNASDQHLEKLQIKFKEGQIVQGRVIGMRLIDGLAVVTLKESKVKQDLFGFMDVQPGMTVLGEIRSVEHYGAFVKLSDGLKALCPLQHMSEFQRAKPSAKFQVGVKMKFKVLACDPATRKVTITHKKTMVSSKLKPITTYDEAVEGLVTHGWISGIEEYGCFVCFYSNVKGLAHRTELGLDPGIKAESAFQIGQVVKCRVLRADPASRRISLSFILSPYRFPSLQSAEKSFEQTVSMGDEVSGLVAHITDRTVLLDVPISNGLARAFMKFEHLSDSLGHIEQLKSVLHPGYRFDRLLVLERDEKKLIVTAKFSLLESAKFLPSDVSQLHTQEVIPGYVASITEAGCFIRFLGGLTGLASVPQVSDGFVHDPSQHFSIGQSVRAQILEVNLVSGRFTLSLKQSRCYSTDVSLLQGYFIEEEKIAELQAKESSGSDLEWAQSFVVGEFVEGEIQDIKQYGVIVNLNEHKDVVGFITHYQLGEQVDAGKHVTSRILDVVKSDGIVDLTLRSELLHKEFSAKIPPRKVGVKRKSAGLEVLQKVQAVVELIKDEYLVLSLPDHANAIAFASTHDYNFNVDPHQKYTLGQRVEATIGALTDSSKVGRLLVLLTSFSDPTAYPVLKRTKREAVKFEAGSCVQGEVVSIQPLEMHVKVGKFALGRVHITQVMDECSEGNPLTHYNIGQHITAKVIGKYRQFDDESRRTILDLTLRPSELQGSTTINEGFSSLSKLATLGKGDIVTGFVKEIQDEWAWLLLSPTIKGRLFILDSSDDPVQLECFKERFKIGYAIKCRVLNINHRKGMVDFTLRGLERTSGKCVEEQIETGLDIKPGDIVGGRVSKVFPGVGGLSVQVGAHLFGRVHITHLHDIWKDNLAEDFKEGQFVKCFVLDTNISPSSLNKKNQNLEKNVTPSRSFQIDLSLRGSLLGHGSNLQATSDTKVSRNIPSFQIEKIEDLKRDLEVQGFVKNVTKKGCFVTLSQHVDARILISNLAEEFIADPAVDFPPGKLVKGRVVSIEPLSGWVDMSLKDPSIREANKESDVKRHVGDFVSGVVRRVESYGLFIAIDSSSTVGLCHVSEISDTYIDNLHSRYEAGNRVHAKILKIDEDRKHIFLGMKKAYFKNFPHITSTLNREDVETEARIAPSSPSEESSESLVINNDVGEKRIVESSYITVLTMPEIPPIYASVPPLDVILEIDDNVSVEQAKVGADKSSTSVEVSGTSGRASKREKKRLKEER